MDIKDNVDVKERIISSLRVKSIEPLSLYLLDRTEGLVIGQEFFLALSSGLTEYYSTACEYTDSEEVGDVQLEYYQAMEDLSKEAEKIGIQFENPYDLLLRG